MFRKWISRLISLGILAAILLLIAGAFGFVHPAFDTAAHFRLHISALLLLCVVLYPVFGGKLRMIAGTLAGAAGLFFSLSVTGVTPVTIAATPGKPVYHMLHLNLLYDHRDPQPVIDTILALDADILSLSETFDVWTIPLKQIDAHWPYVAECGPVPRYASIRIYSKFPFDNTDDYCGPYGTFLKTSIVFPSGDTINVGSVHTRWPWPASGPEQYAAFQPELKTLAKDALIAGDFNATPWSHAVTNFARTGELELVKGIGPTWLFLELPGWMINRIGLPIDHVMHKGQVKILSAKPLEPVGSDHLPVLVDFQIE